MNTGNNSIESVFVFTKYSEEILFVTYHHITPQKGITVYK